MKTFFTLLIVSLITSSIYAQDIIPLGTANQSLQQRWSAATDRAESKDMSDYLLIYTFERMMPENSFIGHFNSDWRDRKKLGEFLYPDMPLDYIQSLQGVEKHSDKKVMKELALIFEFEDNKIIDVDLSTIDAHYDLEDHAVLWLGRAKEAESMTLIKSVFEQSNVHEVKESIITAAGMHKSIEESYTFLKDIIDNNRSSELREDAVFWLSELDNPKALPYLKGIAMNDRDEDVAEKAVFAIYNTKSEESVDTIIELAREAENLEVQEKAIFWLGQLAGKKALDTLGDIVFDEEKTDLQAKAVFALSQLDNGEGIPKLIKAAKEHPNPKIRKKAIFWLGQSGDDRALDALIDLVKK